MVGELCLRSSLHPIHGQVALPGSKSYTNRALVLAALCEGTSLLQSASPSDDSAALLRGLSCLGVEVVTTENGLLVHGTGGQLVPYHGIIDVGPAGTTMRFLTSLTCLVEGGDIVLRGSERMHARPIADLVDAWNMLGGHITYLQQHGYPPLRIRGHRQSLQAHAVMPGYVSSQFFSSLLMIAPLLPRGLSLDVIGPQTSPSYLDMTFQAMRQFGVQIHNHHYQRYDVPPGQRYHPTTYVVEGDASGASYFWGLAAVSGGRVRVCNLSAQSIQGDVHFADLLVQMGCEKYTGDMAGVPFVEIQGPKSLQAVHVDMSSMPDTSLSLAVIAAVAQGTTRITGLHTLRHKETDRLEALRCELSRMGIVCEIGPDWIAIQGGQPRPARIRTYDDHRMAMSFAILAARVSGMVIEEPAVVSKSFPSFWQELSALGVGEGT